MSDALDFLVQLGQDPTLRDLGGTDLAKVMTAAGIPADIRSAILGADQRALERLLGAQANICCMVRTPDDEDEDEEEEDDDNKKPDDAVLGLHSHHETASH